MRIIDADALIETIENVYCKPCKELKRDCNGVKCRSCQYGDEIDDIDSFHTVEQPHWIPCSERLPETNGEYLVTRVSANLYCYIDIVKKTNVSGDIASDIVAWMPLPEPYRESEECENN